MAMADMTTKATSVLGIFLVTRLNPYIINMVPSAKRNSSQLIFFKALPMTFKDPRTPDAFFAASVCDSFKISASVT